MATSDSSTPSHLHLTPLTLPVVSLQAGRVFASLTSREKLYAHYMSRACWAGYPILLAQSSTHAVHIWHVLMRIFAPGIRATAAMLVPQVITPEDFTALVDYTAYFLGNAGPYTAYGDTRFLPRIAREAFALVCRATGISHADTERFLEGVYDTRPEMQRFGLAPEGASAYYSPEITAEEAKAVDDALADAGFEVWNTRMVKGSTPGVYEVHVASAVEYPPRDVVATDTLTVRLVYGDHSEHLAAVVQHLQHAAKYVANENQARTVENLINYFMHGDIKYHKAASTFWVKDQAPDPIVETTLGFIETDRDPQGVRAEYEGFVAVVNKELSAKFGELVRVAPTRLVPLLPWGAAFEKDEFAQPSFTSLEVVTFVSGGLPLGICLPNYDDVRASAGFKNVDLANVASARHPSDRFHFVPQEHQELFGRVYVAADTVLTGLHELVGHGTGKLLREGEGGEFNFDRNLINPLTGAAVATWYRGAQTYGSVFGDISSAMEECRAELVSLYLGTHAFVQEIFGFKGEEVEESIFAGWLGMLSLGVRALSVYDADTEKWGQAHSRARFGILRLILEQGEGMASLRDEGDGEWVVDLDRTKIHTVGVRIVGEFLKQISIYRSTADVEGARAFFGDATKVSGRYLELHRDVNRRPLPRRVFVQGHTHLNKDSGEVLLVEFPPSSEGIIESFLLRERVAKESGCKLSCV